RAAEPSSARVNGSRSIETDTLRVAVGDDDKVSIELLSVGAGKTSSVHFSDVLQLVDVADAGDEYDFAPIVGDIELRATLVGARATMAGPGVAQLLLTHELALPVALNDDRSARSAQFTVHRLETLLRVAGDQPFVECVTRFTNEACDHRLRVRVALNGRATHTLGDGHFAMVERPIALPVPETKWKQEPVPSQYCESAAVLPSFDGSRGVAVFTRGLHEYEAVGLLHDGAVNVNAANADEHALDVTLVRSIGWLSREDIPDRPGHAGPALATPDAQCLGEHAVEFAIAPFAGSWEGAAVASNARRFAAPPVLLPKIPHEHRNHSGQQARELDIAVEVAHGGASRGFPTAGIELHGLELSAVKPAEDGSGDVIVRGFNAGRTPVDVELVLRMPFTQVRRCQLDEQPLVGVQATPGEHGAADAVGPSVPATFVVRAQSRAGEILSWRVTPA
ncbi:MAG: hypothetical protein H7123_07600, partial [Thermoleophilia bacterium]|nr:hypothetical protein [Thermoleophilia bacterium]